MRDRTREMISSRFNDITFHRPPWKHLIRRGTIRIPATHCSNRSVRISDPTIGLRYKTTSSGIGLHKQKVCRVASKNFQLYEITVDVSFPSTINFQFSTVLREDLRPNEVAGLLLMFLVSIIFLLTHLADTALNAECWQPYPLNVGF